MHGADPRGLGVRGRVYPGWGYNPSQGTQAQFRFRPSTRSYNLISCVNYAKKGLHAFCEGEEKKKKP